MADTQVIVSVPQEAPFSPAAEPLLEVPPAPIDYRRLDTEGFTAQRVADWAEKRTCVLTGASSLYALRTVKKGEILSEFGPKHIVSTPNYLTVQVGDTQHIMLSPEWLQYINHSCEPNVFFNTTTFKLEALRDIDAGQEFGFFYPSTEWDMASPFTCRCGHANCCVTIAGAKHLTPAQVDSYRLTQFILGKLGRSPSP